MLSPPETGQLHAGEAWPVLPGFRIALSWGCTDDCMGGDKVQHFLGIPNPPLASSSSGECTSGPTTGCLPGALCLGRPLGTDYGAQITGPS